MNFYWKVGIAGAVVLGLAVVILLLLPGGEEREVEKTIEDAAAAARQGDAGKVISYLSLDFRSETDSYEDACATIRRFVGPGKYRDLELHDVSAKVFGDSASATFRVRVVQPTGLPISFYDRKIEINLRREGGGWRVVSARADGTR
jgi:hypothetical protein